MATRRLLIVHGYSDGSTSFRALGNFFVKRGLYEPSNVFYLDYSSMDDDATFRDLADKLDDDYVRRLGDAPVDVVCHSTGSLVVRAWLALRAERSLRRDNTLDRSPVDRLVCFAPANFGSDLAGLGQSFLGKFRSTFFNSNSFREDFMESGKAVLQGLEPASPFQWELSADHDLHTNKTYFRQLGTESPRCFPFVLAAGNAYEGLEARLIKQRGLPGTDGTVRIAGTSLNTRGCSVDFRRDGAKVVWWPETKFPSIPFAVFAGFNHGSIINPDTPGFLAKDGPGTLALKALAPTGDLEKHFGTMIGEFAAADASNYARLPDDRKGRYQQFFFKVRDDVDLLVQDFYIDFHVVDADGTPNEELTLQFDERFKANVYKHSTSAAHRVVMLDCNELGQFGKALERAHAKLVVEISGVSACPDARYEPSTFVAVDPAEPSDPNQPSLLYPNTTTFVDVVLDRRQTDKLLVVKDSDLQALGVAGRAEIAPSGRAALLSRGRN